MAEYSVPEERTELPTDRRMSQLRQEGAIFSSAEVAQVVTLLAGFYGLKILWPVLLENFKTVFRQVFIATGNREPLTLQGIQAGFLKIIALFGPPLFLFVLCVAVVAALSVMLQTKWNLKSKWIKFNFGALNPVSGIKRIFSIHGFVNVLKAIAKLSIILPIGYFALKSEAEKMVQLLHTSLMEVFVFTGEEMWRIFWRIMYVLIAIAIFDYVWGKFQWMRQNKMTKDEVKDERKSTEGDETTKRKMIQKGLSRIAQRLKKAVPQADVVVTNPTHYAVALKYDRGIMKAPTVVAKGTGFMALRIREIAKESGVPVLERKALARALYASVEVGREIPYELYKAVAEVLAYVYKIKNPWANRRPAGEAGR